LAHSQHKQPAGWLLHSSLLKMSRGAPSTSVRKLCSYSDTGAQAFVAYSSAEAMLSHYEQSSLHLNLNNT